MAILRERELFPHHFWLITSLPKEKFDAKTLLKRNRVRGKAEKVFGELETGLNPQLSSSARFKRATAAADPTCGKQNTRPRLAATERGPSLAEPAWSPTDARRAMRNGSGRRRGLERREVPGAATPRRLQGRGPCTDDDPPRRPIRRRLPVKATENPESIHPSHRLTRSTASSNGRVPLTAIPPTLAVPAIENYCAAPTIRYFKGPKSRRNAPLEPG